MDKYDYFIIIIIIIIITVEFVTVYFITDLAQCIQQELHKKC